MSQKRSTKVLDIGIKLLMHNIYYAVVTIVLCLNYNKLIFTKKVLWKMIPTPIKCRDKFCATLNI